MACSSGSRRWGSGGAAWRCRSTLVVGGARPAERPLLFSGCFRGHIYIHDLSRSLKRAERAWSVPACSMMIPRLPTRLSRLFFFSTLPIGSRRRTLFFANAAWVRDCVHSSRASEPGQRWQCSRFSTAPTQPAQHSQHSQPTDHFYQRQHQLRRAVFQHTARVFFAALEATRKFFPRLKWAKTARGVREIGAYGHCMLRYYACMYCTAFRVAHARLLCQP